MLKTKKKGRDGSAWVDGDGSVAVGLVQIGVEEERSKWRGSEERDTDTKENEMQKKEGK